MGELAAHAIDLFEAGDVEDVRPAFHLAELFLASTLEAERDAAALGFLETIQNIASHRTYGMAAFEQFLGAESQVALAKLMEVWRGKASLAEANFSEGVVGERGKPRVAQNHRANDSRVAFPQKS
ncbi:hypothetical protein GRAN_5047 [Granulicella sibirica]|uniref:DUF7674 domain-containing protein n=2 Tax=Granulicella sibirica TaxID=2479048 RepID=A0A4Q0SWX6_9BACT|nr:hypothetical protein GRAN_5047 [Granulicella sibirica]